MLYDWKRKKSIERAVLLFVPWLFLVSWLLCLNSLSAPFCLSSHLNPPPLLSTYFPAISCAHFTSVLSFYFPSQSPLIFICLPSHLLCLSLDTESHTRACKHTHAHTHGHWCSWCGVSLIMLCNHHHRHTVGQRRKTGWGGKKEQ